MLRKMRFWRPRELAAEARKADGASETTLRIPRPPSLMGRLACIQLGSDNVLLVILHRADLRSESKMSRAGLFQQGADRKVCKIFGALSDERRMIRASWAEILQSLSVARLRSSQRVVSAPFMAGPSSSGAPRRLAWLGATWMKSVNIGWLGVTPVEEISSHTFLHLGVTRPPSSRLHPLD